MKFLVTGFDIFKNEKLNPSWEIAKELSKIEFQEAEIISEKLPVSFKRVPSLIKELLEKYRPDIYLALGLAGGRNNITVERVAINVMDSRTPDNEGYTPEDEPIVQNGPVAYFSTIPIKNIVKVLRENEIPSIISNSAGTYVCNTAFYAGLHYSNILGLNTKVGFIHVPYATIQVLDKNKPSLPLNLMIHGIKQVIKFLTKRDLH